MSIMYEYYHYYCTQSFSMKYKKYKRRITSGALALTLFVGGSSAYAANIHGFAGGGTGVGLGRPVSTSQFLTIKDLPRGRHGHRGGLGLNHNRVIGEVVSLTSTGFTLEVHGHKAMRNATGTPPAMVPFDIRTSAETIYQKDGATSSAADLAIGQKAIVIGTIDPTAQIVTATKVNIITKLPDRPVRGPKKAE
jgi:hypothetical protein